MKPLPEPGGVSCWSPKKLGGLRWFSPQKLSLCNRASIVWVISKKLYHTSVPLLKACASDAPSAEQQYPDLLLTQGKKIACLPDTRYCWLKRRTVQPNPWEAVWIWRHWSSGREEVRYVFVTSHIPAFATFEIDTCSGKEKKRNVQT